MTAATSNRTAPSATSIKFAYRNRAWEVFLRTSEETGNIANVLRQLEKAFPQAKELPEELADGLPDLNQACENTGIADLALTRTIYDAVANYIAEEQLENLRETGRL